LDKSIGGSFKNIDMSLLWDNLGVSCKKKPLIQSYYLNKSSVGSLKFKINNLSLDFFNDENQIDQYEGSLSKF
jgi:hypothetical protein